MSAERSLQAVKLVDADGNEVGIILDGSVYRLQIQGKVLNPSGTAMGDAGTPVRTDPTGSTAQPVTDNGGSLTIDATSLPLPTGAATEATLVTIDADTGQMLLDIQELLTRFGDNVASPAADTLLARIQEQIDLLTTIDADTSNLDVALSTRATEATLATRASEATLAAADTKLGTIDADTSVLAVPTQDYDTGGGTDTMVMRGIALPASGGNVAGGTATDPLRIDPTDGTQQSVKLYDHNGNALSVQDGVAYPAGNDHLLVGGVHESDGNTYHSRMRDDTTTAALKRIMVEAAIAPGSQITTISGGGAVTEESFTEFLTNATHAEDMVQDGSGGDIIYDYDADGTNDTHLTGLRLTFSANSFNFTGDAFGKANSGLTTGILVRYTVNGGSSRDLATIMFNEDFLRLLEFSISQAGNEDAMAASIIFGGDTVLEAGSGDKVEVLIRDDLTANSFGVFYLTATLYGFEVVP